MKNSIKKISHVLFTAVILITVFTMAFPASAENEDTGTYISALSGLVMTKESNREDWSMEEVNFAKNVNMLYERGYSSLWFDFNQEAYNDVFIDPASLSYYYFAPLAIGYQTTTDKNEAITGIVIYNGDNPDATIESDGITFTLMGGWEFEDEVEWVEGLDINRFTRGDYLYIYYTKDANAGEPIMALKGSNFDTESGYECVLDTSGNAADLNNGSNMAIDCTVYLHLMREASTTGSVFANGNFILIICIAVLAVVGVALAIIFLKKKKS